MYPNPIGPTEHRIVQCSICNGDILTKHFNADVSHGRCAFGDEYIDQIDEFMGERKFNPVYNLCEQWSMDK